jgi:ATP-dependent RNA helicase DeaD
MSDSPIIQGVVKALQFQKLNAMQQATLALVATENNIQLYAPTGSGKTLAFLLPLYLHIAKTNTPNTQAIIVVPTRELALQIAEVWRKMRTQLKCVTLFGGHRIQVELNELVEVPQLIIGTPGRINDHLTRGSIDAANITHFVVDEFDKTLELGFMAEIDAMRLHLPNIKKRILVSATHMEILPDFLDTIQFEKIDFSDTTKTTKQHIQYVTSYEKDKINTLVDLLNYIGDDTSIVFVNHREAAERIQDLLLKNKIECIFYHGGLEQIDRTLAVIKFKNKTVNVLIASDIAARGIDIDKVGNIIHYHFPDSEASFTHRNGRTARQEAQGNVYIIKNTDEVLPDYMNNEATHFDLPKIHDAPTAPSYITLTINAGKKNKINKIDIVGFLGQVGNLQKNDIGIIDVLDTISFVAIAKPMWKEVLANVRGKKIKGKDYIFKVAK